MSTLKAILVLSICCLTQRKSVLALTSSSRSFAYPGHHVTRDYDSFDGKTLVYAYCANSRSDVVRECTLVQEQNAFDEKTRKSECNVTLKSEGENNVIDKYFLGVAAFGSDRAILQWQIKRDPGIRGSLSAEKYYKLTIVNFLDCKVHEVKVVVKEYDILHGLLTQTNLITYERTFDVVYPNRELCSEHKVCRQTFDERGKPVGDTLAWFAHDSLFVPILPIKRRSGELGHAIFEMYRQEKIVSIAKDRDVKLVQKIPHVNFTSAHSAAHETIGVCSKEVEKSLKCRQFDSQGKLKLEKTLQFDYPIRFFMHNLAKGEFLLLVEKLIECPASNKQCNDNNKDATHQVIKYDANGNKVGSLKLKGLDCPMVQWKKLSDARDGEYCVSNLCLYDFRTPGNKERFDLITKCFNEKELVKSV